VSLERAEGKREALIRFDPFELDAGSGELRRRGLLVDVPPQAFRVLVMLAERPDEVVTRKAIKEALWPGQSYGDFDSRLNFAIKRLREALGDDAEQPHYIRTVRNAGYRFIAPLLEVQTPSVVLPKSVPAALPRGKGAWLGRGLSVVVTTAALVALAAVFALRGRKIINPEYVPRVDSVTKVLPQARQRIVIAGRGFGLHVPYVHTDSPYMAIRDMTAHWSAGRMIPQNSDEVMVDVESWTDTEIVLSGFSGDYGQKGWKLAAGDELEIAIWNPQSGVGPGLCRVQVVSVSAAR
jgi:DNA-binding winged helix-turn-helix (wHTH) protein